MKFVQMVMTAALVATSLTPVAAQAQAWPNQAVRFIAPVSAGGGTDVVARAVGQKMAESLKQTFIVENRPGAAGAIAAEYAAKAAPDGYTFLIGSSSTLIMLPLIKTNLTYDPIRDFIPVGMMIRGDNVIVVRDSLPVRNLQELVVYAKANPGKLNYGTAGIGTTQHLSAELLSHITGIELTHVPYKGTPDAEADLIAGRIDMMFNNIPPALPSLNAKRTRAIAVASSRRAPALPDVPTAREGGIALEVYGWGGLFAPRGTPQAVIDRIGVELKRVMALPDVGERLVKLGLDPHYLDSVQTAQYMRSEIDSWRDVIKSRKLKFE